MTEMRLCWVKVRAYRENALATLHNAQNLATSQPRTVIPRLSCRNAVPHTSVVNIVKRPGTGFRPICRKSSIYTGIQPAVTILTVQLMRIKLSAARTAAHHSLSRMLCDMRSCACSCRLVQYERTPRALTVALCPSLHRSSET